MQRISSQRALQLITSLVLLIAPYAVLAGQSYAMQMADRSVTISTSTPSATATHTFQMTIPSTSSVGSIVFEYCSNSPLFDVSCSAPAGLNASAAVLSAQSGNTGFVIDAVDTTASKLVISRPPAAMAAVASSYRFDNITNPSGSNQTTFVRVSTYTSINGSGSFIDNGAVAFTTGTSLSVGAFVPPFLALCVGITVSGNCSQATGDSLDLGNLSPTAVRFGTSQFAASTNDPTGCAMYVMGQTLTSGNNVLPGLAAAPSTPGISEFGINLRQNSSPPVGANPSGAGTITPNASYNSPNLFTYASGDQIANSPTSTDYSLLTVSYIANMSVGQPPGVYATTLTYLASAQF